jgi:peroxiredoxin
MKKLLIVLIAFLCSGSALRAQELTGVQVIVFISPVCPICQYYALPLRDLHREFAPSGVEFLALAPGKQFTTGELVDFREKYAIPFPVEADISGMHYTLKARITPEVFVLDHNGTVIYSGRIDDSYAAVGKKRRVVTQHELRDVLLQLQSKRTPSVTSQPAIGCLIEK